MIKRPLPTKRILELNVLPSRDEMGEMAAGDVSRAMNRFIKEKGSVNIVFAAAPSQDEFLVHLSRKRNIDWSRVTCFHLDDYVDLPRNHPNTFEAYLQEHLFNHVQPKQIHFLKAQEGSRGEIARNYTRLIKQSGGTALGTRSTFADLGQTLAEYFGVPPLPFGRSFLQEVR